jgi:hypothetical protein
MCSLKNARSDTFADATIVFRDAGIYPRAMLRSLHRTGRIDPGWKVDRKSLGKVPGRFNSRTSSWLGLSGNHVQVGLDRPKREEAASWPTANVGLLGRAFPAIDSDVGSEQGRRFVEKLVVETFGIGSFAERLRGDCHRRLYAFRAVAPADDARVIRNRSIRFRLPSEHDDIAHGVDILGAGKQYLIAGTHPSGDAYRWRDGASLADPAVVRTLAKIEETDMARFEAALLAAIDAAGGDVVSRRGNGGGSGELQSFANHEPAILPAAILAGLRRLPNTEDTFPHRDDLVRVLSAVKAALGCEADAFEAEVRDWACADPEWCRPEEDFEAVWRSLDRGVRVGQDALDRLFRQHRIGIGAKYAFPDDADAVSAVLQQHISETRGTRAMILDAAARGYIWCEVNTRTDDSAARVRSRSSVAIEWDALKWWRGRTVDADSPSLLQKIQAVDGWNRSEDGMWSFLRDLKAAHAEAFYAGETLHPNFDRGEMIAEYDESGHVTFRVNMREQSRVQRIARRPTRTQERDDQDVKNVLEFMQRIFGRHLKYELDTLSYMVQTGRRPGHLLFLVGDQGTGKSLFTQLLATMFDGNGRASVGGIDGNKLTNDGAVRFAFANSEGRRILEIRELPERSRPGSQAGVTSILKQLVDPGPSGDFVQIEQKGKDPKNISNFARVVITSNYMNAIQVEAQDRRIFYVFCGITVENKPGSEFYSEIAEMIDSPDRLAAFWRYLQGRDISGYRVTAHPPVSNEKLEQQIGSIENPWVRHAWAAVMVLKAAGRRFFDMDEFRRIMEAMSHNESRNTNGATGDARHYSFRAAGAQGQAAIKRLELYAEKVASFRSKNGRLPTIYAMKEAERESLCLLNAKQHEALDALDRDRVDHPLGEEHPASLFRGPPIRER